MPLSSRIGDYGITGAFFLVAQFVAFVTVDPDGSEQQVRGILSYLQQMVSAAPALATPLASLLAAIALLLVFFVGLVIDLLGFVAPSIEVVYFRRELDKQRQWLSLMLTPDHSFLGEDSRRLIQEYKPKRAISSVKDLRENLREAFARVPFKESCRMAVEDFKFVLFVGAYQRIFRFLLISAFADSNTATSQLLQDQLRLWRTSRAVATALAFLAVEVIVLAFPFDITSGTFWAAVIMYLVCWFLAISLATRSFQQLCETILAILHGRESSKSVVGQGASPADQTTT